jgi:hypothetical protein
VIVDAHDDMQLELFVGDGEEQSFGSSCARVRSVCRGTGCRDSRQAAWAPRFCPLSDACSPGDGAFERALAREAELRRAVDEERGVVLFVRTCAELVSFSCGSFLPWHFRGNRSQPTATVLASLSRFRGRPVCHRFATDRDRFAP